MHLLRVVEDFIHLVGDALKAFQSSLIVTDNLGTRRQARGRGLERAEPRPLWGEGWYLTALPLFPLSLISSLPCISVPVFSPPTPRVVSLCACPPPVCLHQPRCLPLPFLFLPL